MNYYQENHEDLERLVRQEVGSKVNSLLSDDQKRELMYASPNDPAEIYEYWAVSSWLADKLEASGEAVVDFGSCAVWGRSTTGQAISLDGVITEIHKELQTV